MQKQIMALLIEARDEAQREADQLKELINLLAPDKRGRWKRRRISPAARRRIAAAQRVRWKKWKQEQRAAAAKKEKRTLQLIHGKKRAA